MTCLSENETRMSFNFGYNTRGIAIMNTPTCDSYQCRTKSGSMEVLIRHIVIELNKCLFDQLNDPKFLEESMVQMTRIMRTDVKAKATYQFEPYGVTSMLIIGASHISIHTWPEHQYADIDLVVCVKDFETEELITYLNERFGTEDVRYMEIQRGVFA